MRSSKWPILRQRGKSALADEPIQWRSRVRRLLPHLILGSALLYCLTTLVWTWVRQSFAAATPGVIVGYWIVPLTILLVSAIGIRHQKRAQWATLVGSLFLTAFLFDWLLMDQLEQWTLKWTRQRDQAQRIARSRQMGLEFDQRTRKQVVADLQASGLRAAVFVPPTESMHRPVRLSSASLAVPLTGISNTTTVGGNETGSFMVFQSDRHGFHNPDSVWDADPIHIVVLGDSFAQGVAVESEQNAVAIVRHRVPNTINLGTSSGGPLVFLATLREYGLDLRPQLVLWFHYEGNDLLDLRNEWSTSLVNYLRPEHTLNHRQYQTAIDKTLVARANEVDPSLTFWESLTLPSLATLKLTRTRSWLIRSIDRGLGMQFIQERHFVGNQHGRLLSILKLADNQIGQIDARLVFVYLPQHERFALAESVFRDNRRAELINQVEELNIPVIDLCDTFAATGDPLSLFPFRMNGHYNADGYRLVGETILDEIDRLGWLEDAAVEPTED